jgi:molybdopterin biosynthesis enzyme MoaB
MRRRSAASTPRAMLSRGISGTIGRCLVLNLPGSPTGAVECLGFVGPVLAHAVKVLGGGVRDCKDDVPGTGTKR